MFDDDPPRPAKLDLEKMSVDELKERIEALKADIVACEAEIEKKQAHKSAADDIFKS
ncbi:DUF1192 domain-containing protein [Henriciella aquimarina]|uniref:DUF1192 domain-containing protein n=1 Tax=Henriciella aquimarina TaxID=545261 RepID=UPI000A031031|nr:DUF1192 domain-containing protein [Henriciella aquimarina]